jgi:hypothetical protein
MKIWGAKGPLKAHSGFCDEQVGLLFWSIPFSLSPSFPLPPLPLPPPC